MRFANGVFTIAKRFFCGIKPTDKYIVKDSYPLDKSRSLKEFDPKLPTWFE